MTQKRTIPEWCAEHGVPYERVRKCSVSTKDASYYAWGFKGPKAGSSDNVQVWHEDFPGWTFTLDLAGDGGIWRLEVSLDDEARERGEAVTTRELRKVPIADLALAARTHWRLYAWQVGDMWEDAVPDRVLQHEHGPTRRLDDRTLAEAMRLYVEAVAEGHATEEAARRYGCSTAAMNRYRRLAVQRGLFTSHGRGRPGGTLTEAGRGALEADPI